MKQKVYGEDISNTINKISSNPKMDTEFGGLIYKIEKDGKVGYGYTPAIRGEDKNNPLTRTVQPMDALKYLPEGAVVVEAYHTHLAANGLVNNYEDGSKIRDYKNPYFSPMEGLANITGDGDTIFAKFYLNQYPDFRVSLASSGEVEYKK